MRTRIRGASLSPAGLRSRVTAQDSSNSKRLVVGSIDLVHCFLAIGIVRRLLVRRSRLYRLEGWRLIQVLLLGRRQALHMDYRALVAVGQIRLVLI